MAADHVRALRVVVSDPFRRDVVHVPLSEQDESLKALPLQALDEPLASAVQIWGCDWQRIGPNALGLECRYEFLRELRVSVVHHDRRLFASTSCLLDERLGLAFHPGRIWMLCR